MSNSSLPNRLPQEKLEKVLETLRQPRSIAVLASLGLHGLLWAALPNLLSDQVKEADNQKTVGIVELSPAERSQLPNQLPELATNLPPQTLPSRLPNPARSTTKLPSTPGLDNSSLYNFPPLTPPPPITFPSLGLPPTFDFNQPLPRTAAPKPKPSTTTIPAPQPSAKPVVPSSDASPQSLAPPVPSTTPAAPARPEKLSDAQIAAFRQEWEKKRQTANVYAFNGPETQDKAFAIAQTNLNAFQATATKVSGGNFEDKRFTKNPEKVDNLFPKDACPFIEKRRNASIGVVVKPDGKLAEAPNLLLPSGYKGLDDLAIDYVAKTEFKSSEQYQLVRFDFIFDPNPVCPAASKPPA